MESVLELLKINPWDWHMHKIIPNLFIGNLSDSKSLRQLEPNAITHIVSAHTEATQIFKEKHYLCIAVDDHAKENLSQYFPICNDFIHAARLSGGNVLVHCIAGVSRSVSLVAAYLMCVENLKYTAALALIKYRRTVAQPNSGFVKQLKDFQDIAHLERLRLNARFPGTIPIEIIRSVETDVASSNALEQEEIRTESLSDLPQQAAGVETNIGDSKAIGDSKEDDIVCSGVVTKSASTAWNIQVPGKSKSKNVGGGDGTETKPHMSPRVETPGRRSSLDLSRFKFTEVKNKFAKELLPNVFYYKALKESEKEMEFDPKLLEIKDSSQQL